MIRRPLVLTLLFALSFIAQVSHAFTSSEIQQGEYITRAAGCADCHTTKDNFNQPMSGGFRIDISPFGTFFTPNITPDVKTGIGLWSERDFVRALREGIRPDGSYYYPTFPFRSYTKLTDSDLHNMYAYIMSLTPIDKPSRAHELNLLFDWRIEVLGWRSLYFHEPGEDPMRNLKVRRGAFQEVPNQSAQWNRGAYLVEAVHHCAECHTPRSSMGGLHVRWWMSGTPDGVAGEIVPNITPDKVTGLGYWTKRDWMQFLGAGVHPQDKSLNGEMVNVVRNTSNLKKADLEAVVTYLMSLKPIHHLLPPKKAK